MDSIFVEVLWSRLRSVVNEQAAALVRASFTPVVSEAEDLAAAVFDARGQMLAQAVRGTPGHINSTAYSVQHFLEEYPIDSLAPGDVLITNDPWKTSGHLNDITVVTPVFRDGLLVAFLGNTCHAIDIGGRPMSAQARDVFEEGLFIPMSKLYSAGTTNEDLFRIIRHNVRAPSEVLGDIHAQVVGNEVGSQQLGEFLEEFGLESLDQLSEEILGRSERAMRSAIREIPDGQYRNDITSDGYEQPIRLSVLVVVDGDSMTIDFAGTDSQSRHGINVVFNYTYAYAVFAIKCITVPELPGNAGTFRPITLLAPEGCILNAIRPAPVAARHTLGQLVPSLIFGALRDAVPDRVVAEGYDADWIIQPFGRDQLGRFFLTHLVWTGGTGARPSKDGLSAVGFPARSQSVPIEVVETLSPLLFHRKELRPDSGGPGRFRGGLGQVVELELRTEAPCTVSPKCDRLTYPPRGIHGGRHGAPGAFSLSTGEKPGPKTDLQVSPGTILTCCLPGGGGYGDAMGREPSLVLEDVKSGLVSIDSARLDYGIVIDPTNLQIDHTATDILRRSLNVRPPTRLEQVSRGQEE